MLRVGVLVSGGGTNLQAILDAMDAGNDHAMRRLRLSSATTQARMPWSGRRSMGFRLSAFPRRILRTGRRLTRPWWLKVDSYELDLIVLAGFLVKIPEAMIAKYRNKIINIHPSLIPSFCGVGLLWVEGP